MRGKKIFIIVLGIVVFSFCGLGEIFINEVMYDPGQCADSYCEWVELFNPSNQTIDLTGCYFDGDLLSGNISEKDYLVLVRNTEKFEEFFGKGKNILKVSLNLINSGKKLKLNGACNDVFDYTNYVDLAKGNNKSLERNKKGQWKVSLEKQGSPGGKNSVYDFSYDYSKLEISEVMVDPFGKDDEYKPLGEWVELHNTGKDPIYLGELVLYDSEDDNELFISNSNTKKLSLGAGKHGVIYRNGDGDFSLSKIQDKVRLYSRYPLASSSLIEEVSFSNSIEGMSWSKINGAWYKTVPTPGKENQYTGKCDWQIDLEMENSIFRNGNLSFQVLVKRDYGSAENITVVGKVEDIFGKVVKRYSPWTNYKMVSSGRKSYSPALKEGAYQLSFELKELSCEDNNLRNNKVLKLIAINPAYKKVESSLEIETPYLGSDNSAEWGDQFQLKVNIYKGQESKSAIEVYVEKDDSVVSKRTKINLYDKYKNYLLTIPIQLLPNCHEKIEDGKAKLVLKGLGLEVKKEFLIEGLDKEVCRDYLSYVKEMVRSEAKIKKANAYQIIELPTKISSGEVVRVKVQLVGDSVGHDFKVWSYLYRGNKCISCSGGKRESNLIKFQLEKDEVKQIEMLVKVDDEVAEGEYKLKVKLNKDGTNRELTKNVYLKKALKESNQSNALLGGNSAKMTGGVVSNIIHSKKEKIIEEIPGIVVYESSSQKAKKLIPYVLVLVFGLLCILLGWRQM